MIIVLTAAALAAQTPPANPPTHSMPMAQGQHEGMKKEGCDCCKDMEAKMKEGHHDQRGAHGA
jgi:Spy/CpxP family protein refolding chaperone